MYPQIRFIMPKLLINALFTIGALLWYLRYPSLLTITGVWGILWIGLTALLIKTFANLDPHAENQRLRQTTMIITFLAPFVGYTLLMLSFYPTMNNWQVGLLALLAWGVAFLVFSGLYFFEGLITDAEWLSRLAIGVAGFMALVVIVNAVGTLQILLEGGLLGLLSRLPDPRFEELVQWVILTAVIIGLSSGFLWIYKHLRG